MAEYKVLITTSGIGSRLGDLTRYTNKCLVRIGKKPAISYIIEAYPEDIEFVITLGYYGDQVKDFLNLAYPDRKFKFVDIDKYEGEGSSLGYSILKAKKELQIPFIFHASDTIVEEPISPPKNNWLGINYKKERSQYRTISFLKNKPIHEKGDLNSDCVYIGLAGIKDFEKFWIMLENEYSLSPKDQSLSDCHAINGMCVDGWEYKEYQTWMDIGNVSELIESRKKIKDRFDILDKSDESIFIFDEFVIKFFHNKKTCSNRVERGISLYPLTPKILGHRENFYKYEYLSGDLLSSIVNPVLFENFLEWSLDNLWIKSTGVKDFNEVCESFYFEKTRERVNRFLEEHGIEDSSTRINGYDVPKVFDMLEKIDKDWLCSKSAYKFHGDYILDNIIFESGSTFRLIDWRQDFGGDLFNGDIYYDLSKLNHNLIFNHEIVNDGHFYTKISKGEIRCDILRSNILSDCSHILHKFIESNGFDLKKVKILTSIIWLNMSPLHEPKMGEFLFYLGKLNLYKNLYYDKP